MHKGVLMFALMVGLGSCSLYTPYACWLGTDRYCSECNVAGNYCVQCWNSYRDNLRGICRTPALNITGCLQYETFNRCSNCDTGFYLTAKGSCREYEENPNGCATGTEDICYTCANTLYVPNAAGICDNSVQCGVTNCLSCRSNGCSRCLPGYTLFRGECVFNSNRPEWNNCHSSTETNFCSSCAMGFFQNSNGVCLNGAADAQTVGSIWGPHCWYCWNDSTASKAIAAVAASILLALL